MRSYFGVRRPAPADFAGAVTYVVPHPVTISGHHCDPTGAGPHVHDREKTTVRACLCILCDLLPVVFACVLHACQWCLRVYCMQVDMLWQIAILRRESEILPQHRAAAA